MLRSARKSPTVNCSRILFMSCWHKFQMIFNGCFIVSRQTLAVAARHSLCRPGVTHLSIRKKATSASNHMPSAPWVLSSTGKLIWYSHSSHFLLYHSADVFRFSFFNHHFCLSVTWLSCSLNALSSTSRVDTPLTADWLQVCFGPQPRFHFIMRKKINAYPTLTFPCSGVARDHITCVQQPSHLFKRARDGG